MLAEIKRFHRAALRLLESDRADETVGEFLDRLGGLQGRRQLSQHGGWVAPKPGAGVVGQEVEGAPLSEVEFVTVHGSLSRVCGVD